MSRQSPQGKGACNAVTRTAGENHGPMISPPWEDHWVTDVDGCATSGANVASAGESEPPTSDRRRACERDLRPGEQASMGSQLQEAGPCWTPQGIERSLCQHASQLGWQGSDDDQPASQIHGLCCGLAGALRSAARPPVSPAGGARRPVGRRFAPRRSMSSVRVTKGRGVSQNTHRGGL